MLRGWRQRYWRFTAPRRRRRPRPRRQRSRRRSLFNLFDYWGAVVAQRRGIDSLADLGGKQLAAARGTSNFTMFEWVARQAQLDAASQQVINTATPGLNGYVLADRADAVQLWEPAYSLLLAKRPDIRILDLDIAARWRSFAGSERISYLGVAAHLSWIAQHRELVPRLYRRYRDAARWCGQSRCRRRDHFQRRPADIRAIERLIEDNKRLGMDVVPADIPQRRRLPAGRTGFRLEGAAALTGLVVAWQIASYFFPPFLFPSVPAIARHAVDIFVSGSTMLDALATAGRILLGMVGAFVLGGILAFLMDGPTPFRAMRSRSSPSTREYRRCPGW
jgi:hypothetical protein